MKPYDYLVILCAGIRNDNNEYEELDESGKYLGAAVRMQAAVDMYHNQQATKFIVVGGGVDNHDPQQKIRKVSDIRDFLLEGGVPSGLIECVISESNTLGNIRALYMLYAKQLAGKHVGILTNFYHLPRTMRLVCDPQFQWQNTFVPVCAEAVVTSIKPAYADHTENFMERVASEIQGLRDLEDGTYNGQFKDIADWKGELHS